MDNQNKSKSGQQEPNDNPPTGAMGEGVQAPKAFDEAPEHKTPKYLSLLAAKQAIYNSIRADWKSSGISKLEPKEYWPMIVGLVAIGVAALTLRILSGQLEIMNGQLQEMRSGSADTHTLAGAAKAQAERMAESMKLDQRAWVAIWQAHITPVDQTGKTTVQFDMVNTGKSPAIDVSRGVTSAIWPTPLLPEPPRIRARRIILRPAAPIPPQAKVTMHVDVDVHDLGSYYPMVKNGTAIFYWIGEIHYKDIFGGQHRTTFCLYQAKPEAQIMSTCERGNSIE